VFSAGVVRVAVVVGEQLEHVRGVERPAALDVARDRGVQMLARLERERLVGDVARDGVLEGVPAVLRMDEVEPRERRQRRRDVAEARVASAPPCACTRSTSGAKTSLIVRLSRSVPAAPSLAAASLSAVKPLTSAISTTASKRRGVVVSRRAGRSESRLSTALSIWHVC
jgi:hypothetical protein